MKEAASKVTALDWYATMPAPSLSMHDEAGHLSIRRYMGTSAEMRQPALNDNILCMHLGGAKKVQRWRDGRMTVHDVELGALTILPAHQVNRWLTTGPVDFAHLTLTDALIEQILTEEFGDALATSQLLDRVGIRDPYLETLFRNLLLAIETRTDGGHLYRDSLLVVLATTLISHHSSIRTREKGSVLTPKGGLAGWRLRRVMDYMEADLAADVTLAELTTLTGLSRAQFFRAFKQSTGLSPHLYRSTLRLDRARTLLDETSFSVEAVAGAVGLHEGARFSARFKQRFGVTPRLYRQSKG
jgi:AraC family transcriptional regulator